MGYPQLDEQLAGNMGFGPEWNCAANVYGGGICLRKTERPVATRQPAAEQKTP